MRTVLVAFSMWSDANSGKGDFPGSLMTALGKYPANATDPSVVARFWALVAAPGIDPVSPKMFVNPLATGIETVWNNTAAANTIDWDYNMRKGITTALTASFGSNNVSYALLSTKMGSEWHNNMNAGCPMICDRNRGTPAAATSSWSSPDWHGNVGWGDCHATFENSSIFPVTIYGNTVPNNNLWAPATSSNAGMLNPGS
jgi:hypothetical protein